MRRAVLYSRAPCERPALDAGLVRPCDGAVRGNPAIAANRAPACRAALAVAAVPRTAMKLIATLTSPYARKVRIVLAEKRIECALVDDSPWAPGTAVGSWNPLGKIPVLVLDDGSTLFDSRVIVEYLDTVSPVGRLLPEPGRQRIAVRRWEALADGICDAASAQVLELRRPARQQSKTWLERQAGKVDAGLRELARDLGERNWCSGEGYSLADIATGCALGYLELRLPGLSWRDDYPNLARLAERLARRPSFAETRPPAA
jgi:glutathione S-transferase